MCKSTRISLLVSIVAPTTFSEIKAKVVQNGCLETAMLLRNGTLVAAKGSHTISCTDRPSLHSPR